MSPFFSFLKFVQKTIKKIGQLSQSVRRISLEFLSLSERKSADFSSNTLEIFIV